MRSIADARRLSSAISADRNCVDLRHKAIDETQEKEEEETLLPGPFS
jgi:hypothetical protein